MTQDYTGDGEIDGDQKQPRKAADGSIRPVINSSIAGDGELREQVRNIISKTDPYIIFCTNHHMSWPEGVNLVDEIMSLLGRNIREAERRGAIKALEVLKQYNGAYIGIDGRRVNDMVSHVIIDERLAELKEDNL